MILNSLKALPAGEMALSITRITANQTGLSSAPASARREIVRREPAAIIPTQVFIRQLRNQVVETEITSANSVLMFIIISSLNDMSKLIYSLVNNYCDYRKYICI